MKSKLSVLLILILASSFLYVLPLVHADTGIIVDPNTYFGYTNGWLNFNSTQNFTTIYEDTTNNFWYFDNLGISVDGANATVTTWIKNNSTVLNLTSISYTCTIVLNFTNLLIVFTPPEGVTGEDSISGIEHYYNTTDPNQPWGWSTFTAIKSGFTNDTMSFYYCPMTMQNFVASSGAIQQGQPFTINMTVLDNGYVSNLQDVELEISYGYNITLDYNQGTWQILTGNPYATLNSSGCSIVQIDPWTAVFIWNLTMSGSQAENVYRIPIGTKANDTLGNSVNFPGDTPEPIFGYYLPPSGTQQGNNENQGSNNSTQNNNSTQHSTYPGNNGTETNSSQIQIPIPVQPVEVPVDVQPQLLMFGIMGICMIIGVVGYYSGRKRPREPSLNSARKEWRKQVD